MLLNINTSFFTAAVVTLLHQRAMYFTSEALKRLAAATKQLSLWEKLRDGQCRSLLYDIVFANEVAL
jgi:hypothetical protein